MKSTVALGTIAVCLILSFVVLIARFHGVEQQLEASTQRVQHHVQRRGAMCDRIELMFSGAADDARICPNDAHVLKRIRTDLAILAPLAEGCITIPRATSRALNEIYNDQVICPGAIALGQALTTAGGQGWPLDAPP